MTEFERRYKKLYRNLYEFHERNYGDESTETKWKALADELIQFTSPFARDVAIAIYTEIERRSLTNENK